MHWSSLGNNDVATSALHDRSQFSPLGRRNLELVERLLKVIHERIPFLWRNIEVAMRVSMERPVYFCGPPAAPSKPFPWQDNLKPAGGTLWCASLTAGFAFRRASDMTRSMKSSTIVAML
jgi:hypothetical protein